MLVYQRVYLVNQLWEMWNPRSWISLNIIEYHWISLNIHEIQMLTQIKTTICQIALAAITIISLFCATKDHHHRLRWFRSYTAPQCALTRAPMHWELRKKPLNVMGFWMGCALIFSELADLNGDFIPRFTHGGSMGSRSSWWHIDQTESNSFQAANTSGLKNLGAKEFNLYFFLGCRSPPHRNWLTVVSVWFPYCTYCLLSAQPLWNRATASHTVTFCFSL